ncbi:MAG: hypothetical protein M3Y74_02400, partial [Chloroflexota bacterium]|nr:hypothetical protein [Chloroflexota bacterium]
MPADGGAQDCRGVGVGARIQWRRGRVQDGLQALAVTADRRLAGDRSGNGAGRAHDEFPRLLDRDAAVARDVQDGQHGAVGGTQRGRGRSHLPLEPRPHLVDRIGGKRISVRHQRPPCDIRHATPGIRAMTPFMAPLMLTSMLRNAFKILLRRQPAVGLVRQRLY